MFVKSLWLEGGYFDVSPISHRSPPPTQVPLFTLTIYIPNQHYRCALAQYRLSSHNLGIETGRHTKPPTPKEKRLCLYCNNGFVDDEIHLLTNCAAHTDIRHRLTTNIEDFLEDYDDLSDVQKFISVMSSSNKVVINELARFVHDAFKQRLCPTST